MLRTWRFHCCDLGSILGRGTVNKILQAARHGRERKKKIRRRSKGSINPSDLAQGGRSSAKTGVLQFMG